MTDDGAVYVTHDGRDLAWLGDARDVARWAQGLGASSVVVWRVDPQRRLCERILSRWDEQSQWWVFIGPDGAERLNVAVEMSTDEALIVDLLANMGPLTMVQTAERNWPQQWSPPGYERWGFTLPDRSYGQIVVRYCPTIIVRQVAAVGDHPSDFRARLANYARAMYLRLVWHVENEAAHPDPVDRDRVVDDLLYRTNPDLLSLMSSIQLAAQRDGR